MSRIRRIFSILLVCGIGVAVPMGAGAERVVLTSGEEIEGQLIEQNAVSVTIQTLTNNLTIPRTRIREILPSEPGSIPLHQALECARQGRLGNARELLDKAIAAGASRENIDKVAAEIDKRETEIELARYRGVIDEARALFNSGKEEDAMALLGNVLQNLAPDSKARGEIIGILCDFHLNAAAEYRDRVTYERAVRELNKVIELDPDRAMAYIELGDIYKMSSGTWNLAITNYKKGLSLGEGNVDDEEKARINWEMGEINRQRQNWGEAARHYKIAYDLNPSVNLRIVDRFQMACLRFAMEVDERSPETALLVVDEGLKIRVNPDLLEEKGRLLSTLGQHEDSNVIFAQLNTYPPPRRGIYYAMALNHLAMGEILTGREMLQREIELFPNNYDALCLLGDYALQRDDYDAAVDFYTRARTIDTETPRAMLGLGKTFRMRAELEKARESVTEVLVRLPEDREANLEMGRIYLDEGELNQARDFFSEVLRLIDEASVEEREEMKELHADALIARGEISLLTAGPGTANVDFRKALDVLPDYADAYFAIGKAYRKKFTASKNIEDLKTAEENLLKAIELQPENAQYALELGILYAQDLAQADPENEKQYLQRAIVHWKQYIELGGANSREVSKWIQESGV